MLIKFKGNILIVTREATDKKYYGTHQGAGESNFLYALKEELNKKGFDLIKKRMWKDGHLVDDIQQYLRVRSSKSTAPHVHIYNSLWALRGLNDDFNEGEVEITIDFDIYDKQPDCRAMVVELLNPPVMDKFLEDFVKSYIATAIWSSTDTIKIKGKETDVCLDEYAAEHKDAISDQLKKECTEDCMKFIAKVKEVFGEEKGKEILERPGNDLTYLAPHDFWLTRAGHGAGFWDGDWDEYDEGGKQLTVISEEFPMKDLVIGDDKKIYIV